MPLKTAPRGKINPMGKLYVVSTPIGNLADITLRALEVLKNVDLILSEDTRETDKILKTYQIECPQISYRDENHDKVFPHILDRLTRGENFALVSDSGTPVISDPGFKLIRELRKRQVPVESVPGPSAVTAALSVSSLPSDNFTFLGFLPKKASQRKEILVEFEDLPTTLILYESPYRIKKLLQEIAEIFGSRTVSVIKDLTKKFEKFYLGHPKEILEQLKDGKPKGEYVVLIAKKGFGK